jgi:hypothetical protein
LTPILLSRYAGGPVIIIKLTEKQADQIKKNYKPYGKMKLTKRQQAEIASITKMASSAESVESQVTALFQGRP